MSHKVQEALSDEMWSFVGGKKHPWWLWEALDHQTGRIVAYTFGRRANRVLLKLKALLEPFGIRRFYTDGWGLSPTSRSTPSCGRQAEDATAGTEASHAPYTDQTLGEENDLLLEIRPDARDSDWAVHQ